MTKKLSPAIERDETAETIITGMMLVLPDEIEIVKTRIRQGFYEDAEKYLGRIAAHANTLRGRVAALRKTQP